VHPDGDVSDPGPRIQPGAERGERVGIRAATRRFQRDEKQAGEAVSTL